LQKLRAKILRESRNGACSITLERLRSAIIRGDLRANSVELAVSEPEKSHVAAVLRTEHERKYMGISLKLVCDTQRAEKRDFNKDLIILILAAHRDLFVADFRIGCCASVPHVWLST